MSHPQVGGVMRPQFIRRATLIISQLYVWNRWMTRERHSEGQSAFSLLFWHHPCMHPCLSPRPIGAPHFITINLSIWRQSERVSLQNTTGVYNTLTFQHLGQLTVKLATATTVKLQPSNQRWRGTMIPSCGLRAALVVRMSHAQTR